MREEKIKYLSEDEIQRFFDQVKNGGNVQHHAIFKLMFHCGLRVSEATGIQMKDLHPNLVEVFIDRRKGGINRHIPLRPDDQKLLNRWLKVRQTYPNAKDNPYLFITKRSFGGSMSMINVQKAHEKYCKLAGIPKEKQHSHVWRHSCAVSMLLLGHDVYAVKNHLGHTSLQSSLVYLELAPPDWKQISQRVVNSFPV